MVAHVCNSSYSGGWGTRITWTWEAEVAASGDCTITLQPGQQSETLSQRKKKWLPCVYSLPLWVTLPLSPKTQHSMLERMSVSPPISPYILCNQDIYLDGGGVGSVFNSSTLGGQRRWITWGQGSETSLVNMAKPHFYQKYKPSLVWGHTPVLPATRKAELEKCLNLGEGGWSELRFYHCTPAWITEQNPVSKKRKKHFEILSKVLKYIKHGAEKKRLIERMKS